MHALIDGDIPLFEAASVGTDKETGEVHSFEYVEQIFLNKIQEILTAVGATSYTLYLTGKNNFRKEIATVKPYKGTRVNEKPFHYANLKAYILSLPEGVLVEGMEADDALAIAQTSALNRERHDYLDGPLEEEETVICTRDKDLRQVPGWHYGWEMGLQPEFAMQYVDALGEIELITRYKEDGRVTTVKDRKIKGTGSRFFYSQLVTGDTVDNIPGLPGAGAVKAYAAVADAQTDLELFNNVYALYEEKYGEEAEDRINEQAYLLWMVRGLYDDGKPVMWTRPLSEGGENE